MGARHVFTEPQDFARRPGDETLAQIAAFADTLDDTDELYWPALAAADGCEASLAELNAMLVEDDCYPFDVPHARAAGSYVPAVSL